jgi:hypothetical protein
MLYNSLTLLAFLTLCLTRTGVRNIFARAGGGAPIPAGFETP